MDSLTFGQFLLKEGLVNYDDILKARMLQKKNNLKLGDIAVQLGLLTEEQVQRILIEQEDCGTKFGQIAVRDNVLSQEQVDDLLKQQTSSHVYFGEALVQVGAIAQDLLNQSLKKFDEFKAGFGTSEDDFWFKVQFQGRQIDVDADGFLRDMNDWDEHFGHYLADKEDMKLDERYFEIFTFIRDYYAKFETPPMPKVIVKAMNKITGDERYTVKSLCALFPENSIRKACQLAGIPKPPGCT